MLRKFYEKVLPSQGVYCVTGIDTSVEPSKVKNNFCDSLEDMFETMEKVKAKNQNTFVALSTFDGYSRKAENAIFSKSFFIDLDVGETKDYQSKEEASRALDDFITITELPEPVRVDSGRGIHAYWPLDIDVPIDEWKPYAEKFKSLCMDNGLKIDPVVTADAARILRAPESFNYKEDPPLPTFVISEDISVFSFEEFKSFLGEIEQSFDEILASLPKGDLTDEQKSMLKKDNFETTFERIAIRSLEGDGCAQIAEVLTNPNGISYDTWVGALSIAVKCDDGETAIHKMSEDYEGYTYEATVKKAYHSGIEGARRCETFARENPSKCEGCKHRGTISSPIQLGKALRIAVAPTEKTEGSLRTPQSTFTLPEAIYPFTKGVLGGIYYIPASTVNKKTGEVTHNDPVLISQYDLYPLKRIYSLGEGECLYMRAHLPNDAVREFMMPMKHIYSLEKFKEIMTSNGVLFNPLGNGVQYLMSYIYKWGAYLIDTQSAEIMRTQMGWTDDDKRESFVCGQKEYVKGGKIIDAPISSLCRPVSKILKTRGSYEQWKESCNKLSNESMEIHAFTLLCGFGSVLMNYTSTPGVTLALTGKSGSAKTGALYAALSVWGDPKAMSIATNEGATANALVGRYTTLHNIPFGVDEIGNIKPEILSQLILKISSGKAKAKMQGSINAEREVEESASLIGIMTANGELYDKLGTIKKNPEGEVARLIELKMLGVPKFLEENTAEGPAIFDTLTFNYGFAGPDFIQHAIEYTEVEMKSFIGEWIRRFKGDFGDYMPYRYYENIMGVAMTAGELLAKHDILHLPLERIFRVITGHFIGIKDGTVKISDVDYESILGGFINANQGCMLAIKDGKVSMEPRNAFLIRADVDKSLLSISVGEFNKYLSDMQVSSRELIHNLKTLGISTVKKRVRMGVGWKDATAEYNVFCYQFDSTNMVKDIVPKND